MIEAYLSGKISGDELRRKARALKARAAKTSVPCSNCGRLYPRRKLDRLLRCVVCEVEKKIDFYPFFS